MSEELPPGRPVLGIDYGREKEGDCWVRAGIYCSSALNGIDASDHDRPRFRRTRKEADQENLTEEVSYRLAEIENEV
jgi:hypothetical protein